MNYVEFASLLNAVLTQRKGRETVQIVRNLRRYT